MEHIEQVDTCVYRWNARRVWKISVPGWFWPSATWKKEKSRFQNKHFYSMCHHPFRIFKYVVVRWGERFEWAAESTNIILACNAARTGHDFIFLVFFLSLLNSYIYKNIIFEVYALGAWSGFAVSDMCSHVLSLFHSGNQGILSRLLHDRSGGVRGEAVKALAFVAAIADASAGRWLLLLGEASCVMNVFVSWLWIHFTLRCFALPFSVLLFSTFYL